MIYKKSDVAWFFSSKIQPDLFVLSNMSSASLLWRGVRVASSENLYQASKYHPDTICLSENAKPGTVPCVQKRVLQARNAMSAKMTQKCAVKAGLVRPEWNDISVSVMQWVLELKLQQHPETFGAVLRSTGDLPIVEVSRNDQFWGCLCNKYGPEYTENFEGQNMLGKLLMQLRDQYDWVTAGNLTFPDGFLLF